MGVEIERKFLVAGDGWRRGSPGVLQRQGYLWIDERGNARVRVEGGRATLTIKGAQRGLARAEFEYAIPPADAEEILATLCGFVVEKTRYRREHAGRVWEVDVFHGANEGLVTAELELAREDDAFEAPPWLGADVSHDPRYRVAWLSRHPYRDW
jgi:CYTH domain-containing protein